MREYSQFWALWSASTNSISFIHCNKLTENQVAHTFSTKNKCSRYVKALAFFMNICTDWFSLVNARILNIILGLFLFSPSPCKISKKKHFPFFSFPPTHSATVPTNRVSWEKKSPVRFNQLYTDVSKHRNYSVSTKMVTVWEIAQSVFCGHIFTLVTCCNFLMIHQLMEIYPSNNLSSQHGWISFSLLFHFFSFIW